ncbi:hypothetical protein TorRG33x02_194910 [Trema orientale]|uniref:Uncharacterized protein n=1 Tax=Trema orientale TaxID=63057 RepID=A0A2P5EGP4_TREOI|nr:hypothetical protein TorRG33x02_194910 [Trema orientale]
MYVTSLYLCIEGLLRASLWHPKRVRIQEEDKGTLCCCTYIRNVEPRPLDPSNIYQQFEIISKKYCGFSAKSVAPNGHPPSFLRRKYWGLNMRTPRHYHLEEAPGLNSSLRAHIPEPNLSHSDPSSQPNIVVGKRVQPICVCEGRSHRAQGPNEDIHVLQNNTRAKEVFVYGRRAVWEERKFEDGVIWFKNCEGQNGVEEERVGLSLVTLERMKWEQERVGWVSGDEKGVRVVRREEIGGTGTGWRDFGCFVLVERFVLIRMDGNVVLAYDFKHIHQI